MTATPTIEFTAHHGAPLMAAALTMIGDLPLVTPKPIDELHPRTIARVDQIEAAAKRGAAREAARLALALEEDLGITTADRIEALRAVEPWERALEDALQRATVTLTPPPEDPNAKRRKRKVPPPPTKPLRVHLPDAERGRSEMDIARFDKAVAALLNPREALTEVQQKERLRAIADIEAEPHRRRDATWLEDAQAETARLAQAREEDVERAPTGRISVTSRDPLLSLLRAGHLTTDQYDTGVEVRDMYERRSEGLGSQMDGIGGGSSPTYDNRPAVRRGIQRAKALLRIVRIESAVLTGTFRADDAKLIDVEGWRELFADRKATPEVALGMFRWVCEHGNSIRSASSGSTSFDRNATALARALDVANVVIRGK